MTKIPGHQRSVVAFFVSFGGPRFSLKSNSTPKNKAYRCVCLCVVPPPPVLVAGVLSDSASSLASHTISAERLSRFSRRVFDWRLASFVFLVCFVLLLGFGLLVFEGRLRFSNGGQPGLPGRPAGLPSQPDSAACRVAYRVAFHLGRPVGLPTGFASALGSL